MLNKIMVLAFAGFFATGTAIAAGNGYVLKDVPDFKSKDMPICQELLQILNLPENAHTIMLGNESKPYTIPKRFKNFSVPDWQPVSGSEVGKYITDTKRFNAALELVKNHALNIEKDWDGKGDFQFEKATGHFDNTKRLMTMLRFRLPTWNQWSCVLGNDAPSTDFERFNYITDVKGINRFSATTEQCSAFMYSGSFYYTHDDLRSIRAYRPKTTYRSQSDYVENPTLLTFGKLDFYTLEQCKIENHNARKEYDEYMRNKR